MMLGVAFGGLSSILSGANLLKIGMMAASAIGMYLLNGKKEKGEIARLSDLKVSSSSYGRGIPIVYGTMRVTGNMFWATDFEETLKHFHPKGKDGKKAEKKGTPYYEYHANYAMALCEGPIEEVLRIWADSNLIYDKHNPTNEDIVGPGFSQEDSSAGGKSGFGMAKKKGGQGGDSGRFQFRLYCGTESQHPDPFMVQKQGASMVPAHRGLCYLFFEHFALADFGNRVPTITAEVSTRKQMGVHFRTLENLPNTEGLDAFNSSFKYVDPERYRFYVEENSDDGRLLRIYDLSTDKEIRRIYDHEVLALNADNPNFGYNSFSWVGLAGNGDIVIRFPGGSNSNPIGFLDPNTFICKSRFGVGRTALSNSKTSIVRAQSSTPASYIELNINLDGSIEATPKRATIIKSFNGNFYIFGEDHDPKGYFKIPGSGFSTSVSDPVPTSAEIFGGRFYVTTNNTTQRLAKLLRLDWTLNNSLIGNAYLIENDNSYDNMKIIRDLDVGVGNFSTISIPQLLAGTEEVVWIETLTTSDPVESGTFAVAVEADDEEGEIVWREKITQNVLNTPNDALPVNTSNKISWLHQDDVWSVDFAARDVSYYQLGIPNLTGPSSFRMYWPQRGAILTQFYDPTDNDERKWVLAMIDRNNQVPVDIDFIIRDMAYRVGIPSSRVDTTRLNQQDIVGYILENPTSARKVMEELAQVFMFDAVESDYSLKIVSRGYDPVITIPQKDLGVTDNDTQDYFNEQRTQEIDLPQTTVVSYINPAKDYQVHSQHYRRPRSPMAVMQSRDKLELNLPMAMDKHMAKQLAHKICMSVWTERNMYDVLLPWTYLQYDPTDVMRFEMDDGLTFEARMMKMDLGANFAIECSGTSQTPAAYYSDAQAQDEGGVIYEDRPWPPQTKAHALNVPYLSDNDVNGQNKFLFYYGAAALTPGFSAASIEYRVPGAEWEFVGMAKQELVWGSVAQATPPPPHGPWATDDQTVIQLLPAHPFEDASGYTYPWESIPASDWPSEDNCIIIGEEVIYFRDAEIDPQNGAVYISHLIRGARGTENAALEHGPNERFCIRTGGLEFGLGVFGEAKQTWMFRSFSTYSIYPPFRYDVRLDAASHMPWGPNRFTREMRGNFLEINWERRTRYAGEFRDGSGSVPLNEEEERYELYVLEQPYDPDFFDPENPATYMRAFLDLDEPEVDYTIEQRTADGYDIADPLHLVCFQVSAQIGRGFPGYATLYPSILI